MTMCDHHSSGTSRRSVLRGAGALALGAAATPVTGLSEAVAGHRRRHRVLVYSRTGGYRHASIPLGVTTIEELGAEHGFAVEASEDPAVFSDRNLRRFTAVVFLNTTAEVMTPPGRMALRRFVLSGGGWAGVHSAADTEYDWSFYTRLLAGGRFLAHPLEQPGVMVRESARHISTRHLPERWQIPLEEFYSFTSNPRDRARVLLSIDESSYMQDPNTSHLPSESYPDDYEPVSGVMGDHPMSWQHRVGQGLSWYTALGHEVNMYLDESYRQHLLGGLLTVTRHGRRNLPA
ncbi:MAG TPA: ThuA domain-containing protein [Nocardioidaceae bacterium]|nr:ThuA domain-containing protein [Nocardioidaceae bacterium]